MWLRVTNTLAYYNIELYTAVKNYFKGPRRKNKSYKMNFTTKQIFKIKSFLSTKHHRKMGDTEGYSILEF